MKKDKNTETARPRRAAGFPVVLALLAVLVSGLLVGCGGGEEETKGEIEETALEIYEPDGASSAENGEMSAGSDTAEPVSYVQLVPGYGLVEAGQPAVYVPETQPEPLKTEGATAWLLGAFYQDGALGAQVLILDDSAAGTEADGEESPFLARVAQQRESSEEGEGFYIEETGQFYPFQTISTGKQYGSRENGGGILTVRGIYQGERFLTEDGLTGELRVRGFEEGFPLRLVPAGEPQMFDGGKGEFLAEGETREQELYLRCYGIWKDGGGVSPMELTLDPSAGSLEALTALNVGADGDKGPSGLLAGSAPNYWKGALPEGVETSASGEWFVTLETARVTTGERVEGVSIPVPEDETLGEGITVETELARITLKNVEKRQEPYLYGTADGKELSRPALDMDVELEAKEESFRLMWFYGIREGADEIDWQRTYDTSEVLLFPSGGKAGEPLTRMTACYEEGGTEAVLDLTGFVYEWDCGLRLPVTME